MNVKIECLYAIANTTNVASAHQMQVLCNLGLIDSICQSLLWETNKYNLLALEALNLILEMDIKYMQNIESAGYLDLVKAKFVEHEQFLDKR